MHRMYFVSLFYFNSTESLEVTWKTIGCSKKMLCSSAQILIFNTFRNPQRVGQYLLNVLDFICTETKFKTIKYKRKVQKVQMKRTKKSVGLFQRRNGHLIRLFTFEEFNVFFLFPNSCQIVIKLELPFFCVDSFTHRDLFKWTIWIVSLEILRNILFEWK